MKRFLAVLAFLLLIACNKGQAPENDMSETDSILPAIETLPGDSNVSEPDTTQGPTYYEYRP